MKPTIPFIKFVTISSCKLFNIILLISYISFTGCNSLPADLQSRKDECIRKVNQLADKEKTASGNSDYKQLTEDYTNLKNEIVSYTADCNSRGISKENDKLINEIDGKISKFKSLSASSDSYSSGSSTICSICGRKFAGNGYEEVSDGVWKTCSNQYQCQICSPSCGMKHTAKMNGIINSLPESRQNRDDKIYEKNVCSMCNGTGIEKNTSHLTDEYGRVCPMCDGKGVRTF